MSTSFIRIVMIDDHPIVRDGVRMILENDPRVRLVGETGDLAEGIDLIRTKEPDLILLDVDLFGRSSLDRINDIKAVCPESRILILTGLSDVDIARRAALMGAHGLVSKHGAGTSLLTAIKKVAAGEMWFDRALTSRIVDDAQRTYQTRSEVDKQLDALTARERQIAGLISAGMVNREIAERLRVKEKTVRNTLTQIYSKLGLSNRLELAIYISRHGSGKHEGS